MVSSSGNKLEVEINPTYVGNTVDGEDDGEPEAEINPTYGEYP